MRKSLSTLFLVLVTLAVSVSSALAAPALANRNATLQRVTYERGGITLLFHATGLTQADLQKTSFTAHSQQWSMACNFASDTTIRCHVSKHLSRFAGESFHGTLAGIQFSGTLPRQRKFPSVAVSIPATMVPLISSTAPETSNTSLIETSSDCPAGQTLVYDFEWSGTARSQGYITSSTTYYDTDAFYAEYGSYYDDVSTTYNSQDNIYYYMYYFDNTYTITSSGSIAFSRWDAYVDHMESLGYTVEKSGEHCE
jgi:hypothetical protein